MTVEAFRRGSKTVDALLLSPVKASAKAPAPKVILPSPFLRQPCPYGAACVSTDGCGGRRRVPPTQIPHHGSNFRQKIDRNAKLATQFLIPFPCVQIHEEFPRRRRRDRHRRA